MKMMKKAFADSTVMTIAHRLNTIIESDLILMLQSGELLEQGNP
jgi:ABC-type multidrug transport system fused ATPase/permease subunit